MGVEKKNVRTEPHNPHTPINQTMGGGTASKPKPSRPSLTPLAHGSFAVICGVTTHPDIVFKISRRSRDHESEVRFLTLLAHPKAPVELRSPHVVEWFSAPEWQVNGVTHRAVVLERGLCDLTTLLDGTAGLGPRHPTLGLYWARQLASAIQHCHENHVAHCDIKLDNLIINQAGVIKLIDFAACITPADQPTMVRLGGSPLYMSPESLDPSMYTIPTCHDAWAVGVSLFAIFTGNFPHHVHPVTHRGRGALYQLLHTNQQEEFWRRHGEAQHLPTKLRILIMRLLSFAPKARPGMKEVVETPMMQTSHGPEDTLQYIQERKIKINKD